MPSLTLFMGVTEMGLGWADRAPRGSSWVRVTFSRRLVTLCLAVMGVLEPALPGLLGRDSSRSRLSQETDLEMDDRYYKTLNKILL